MSTRGKFIIIEGGDGAGKSSVIAYLRERTKNREDVVFTREPGGTPVAERIRSVLMEMEMSTETELMLFCAARKDHVEKLIHPNLQAGINIICDRFSPSTVAYQIYGRNRQELLPVYSQMNLIVTGWLEPGTVILLDVEPEIGLQRKNTTGLCTRFDKEDIDFHTRVRDGFLFQFQHQQSSNHRWFLVPTTEMSEQEVQEAAWKIIQGIFASK